MSVAGVQTGAAARINSRRQGIRRSSDGAPGRTLRRFCDLRGGPTGDYCRAERSRLPCAQRARSARSEQVQKHRTRGLAAPGVRRGTAAWPSREGGQRSRQVVLTHKRVVLVRTLPTVGRRQHLRPYPAEQQPDLQRRLQMRQQSRRVRAVPAPPVRRRRIRHQRLVPQPSPRSRSAMFSVNYFCRRIASQRLLPKEGRSRPPGECPTTPLSVSCQPAPVLPQHHLFLLSARSDPG